MKTIYVMTVRQIKKYWRSRARMIGSVGQPLLFLVALGFGFGPIYARAGGGNYINFLAPGIIAMTILFSAMFSGISTIWDRQFGFLKETLVAPVSRMSIMLGQTIGGAIISLFQGIFVLILSLIVGFRPSSVYIIPAIFFMFVIALLFSALGIAISSRMSDMQAFPIIMNFVVQPLFFLSGALFPTQGLPSSLSTAIKLNPLYYGVNGVRSLLAGTFAGTGLDLLVLTCVLAVILIIGARLFRGIEV